jgi:hypothetical protein
LNEFDAIAIEADVVVFANGFDRVFASNDASDGGVRDCAIMN